MLQPGVPVAIALVFAFNFGWQLRCHLKLPAWWFHNILNDSGRTSKVYFDHAGHELSMLCSKRHRLLKELCKKELVRLNPNSKIEDPIEGVRCDGKRRSAYHAQYDFSMNGRQINCKSARMSWRERQKCWLVNFRGVKLQWPGYRDRVPFDDLYLILFSPDSLHIIKHDLHTGVSTCGKETGTRGHAIVVAGASGQECWQAARSQILDKFLAAGHCKLASHIDLSATEVRTWLAQHMGGTSPCLDSEYKGVPLNQMAPQLRGLRIEQIAFEVDQLLHPNCSFSRASSKVDWVRGGVKVEVKHGQMCFNKGGKSWKCSFSNIQCASSGVRARDMFDELWLAIYSPFGIHILKHPGGNVHLSLSGLKVAISGKDMHVLGGQNVIDVRKALDKMLKKMETWGCEPLATIVW